MAHGEADEAFTIELTPELRAFVLEPLAGSATAKAKAFVYDVVALAIKLATTTPEQRLDELDRRIEDMRVFRSRMT